ncbi:unnamed protein product [Caenorhabditis sp. 36 PRJEB53466]|nr:unnamed protein product [Caenorhabditis sp. 36 PRJEB53466]
MDFYMNATSTPIPTEWQFDDMLDELHRRDKPVMDFYMNFAVPEQDPDLMWNTSVEEEEMPQPANEIGDISRMIAELFDANASKPKFQYVGEIDDVAAEVKLADFGCIAGQKEEDFVGRSLHCIEFSYDHSADSIFPTPPQSDDESPINDVFSPAATSTPIPWLSRRGTSGEMDSSLDGYDASNEEEEESEQPSDISYDESEEDEDEVVMPMRRRQASAKRIPDYQGPSTTENWKRAAADSDDDREESIDLSDC